VAEALWLGILGVIWELRHQEEVLRRVGVGLAMMQRSGAIWRHG
jgi:hypothetical protein